jgi:hypothetical protein
MGLKLTQKPTFTAKVDVDVANDKGGFERHTIRATFKRATTDEVERLSKLEKNTDVIRDRIVDFGDVLDDDGNQVPFSSENLEGLLAIPAAIVPLTNAFYSGNNGAKAKNS